MYLAYTLLVAIALVLSAPWWLVRMLRSGKYRAGLAERFGRVPRRLRGSGDVIWVHAVSVGELLAITPVVRQLEQRLPGQRVVISTTTVTAQQLARERFGDDCFYFPLDLPSAIAPYLRELRPKLVVIAETEFWPNFLRMSKAAGASIAIVNARISDRSFPRYRFWRRLMRRVLQSVDLFLAQGEEDARRLRAIGAAADHVNVSGNLKFDLAPQPTTAAAGLLQQLTNAAAFPIFVCGSTVEGEEFVLLSCFQSLLSEYPNALLVLAPRHPERFESVASVIAGFASPTRGMAPVGSMRLWRRSQLRDTDVLRGGVLLLDTLGELAPVYKVATVAFVGGSLVRRGGHNIIEPARCGVPILVGPHTENFRDIVGLFQREDAVRVVHGFREGDTKADLGGTVRALVGDPAARRDMGERAARVVARNTGATNRTVERLLDLIAPGAHSIQAHQGHS